MSLSIYVRNHTRQSIFNVELFLQKILDSMNPPIQEGEISVLFCGDSFIRRLNKNYRGKDRVTDVLAFCAQMDGVWGDIVVSLARAKKQAQETWDKEVETLLCHGLLHLFGYDHEKSPEAYAEMMSLQEQLLQKNFGVIIL